MAARAYPGVGSDGGRRRGRRSRNLVVVLLFLLPVVGMVRGTPSVEAIVEPSQFDITRVQGADRYATAAALSAATFSDAATVYIARGDAFPDALAGGPRAAADGAPILLVTHDAIPPVTADELARLQPSNIVVLGGAAAVSDAVVQELGTDASVRRLAGNDRYDTAAKISADLFAPGVDVAYLATGVRFPDALAGGVGGTVRGGPVLLTDSSLLPSATAAELQRLQPASIVFLGGPAAISDDVVYAVGAAVDTQTRRLAGWDRLMTAIAISEDTYPDGLDVDTVYLATGYAFPDALAAVPVVSNGRDALVLTSRDCVTPSIRDEIARLAPDHLVVVGGPAAVGAGAASLEPCVPLPPEPMFSVVAASEDESLEPIDGSGPRPIAAMLSPRGNRTRFVVDEVLVTTGDNAVLQAFLAEHGGTVLQTIPAFGDMATSYLVRLAGTEASQDRAALGSRLQWLDADATGNHTFSSTRALDTMVAAATARVDGLQVGLNFVAESTGLVDRDVGESVNAQPDDNPFNWVQFSDTTLPRIGTAEAWRLLEIAGYDIVKVPIAIIDGGFATANGDYPSDVTGNDGQQNPLDCGGSPCPWHGTDVAITAGGVLDNGFGSVGSAGPVGKLRLYRHTGGAESMAANIQRAVSDGARVINMSFAGSVDAAATTFMDFQEDVTQAAANAGIHLFAAAGNDGVDVDAEDCFVGCWEEEWFYPCENDGVICVGGLADGTRNRDPSSNFGKESCESKYCQVEIFAPFTVRVGENPSNPGDSWRPVSGTSVSSPYVSGVMAQIVAVNPPGGSLVRRLTLLQTAFSATHPDVSRVVNAYGAVKQALYLLGNSTPYLEISTPAPGDVPYGGFGGVPLTAEAHDVEDGDDIAVTWEVEKLSTGQTWHPSGSAPSFVFPESGLYWVRASTTDSGGKPADDIVLVDAVNFPPEPSIDDPAVDGAQYEQGVPAQLSGSATDPNQFGGVDCGGFTWRLDGSQIGTGCDPVVTFTQSVGSHTLSLTVVDDEGMSGSTSRPIQITAPPSTGPPTVSITNPIDGNAYNPNASTSLTAFADDPDGDPMTFRWQVTYSSTTKTISTSQNDTWTPSDDVPFNCGGVAATITFTATASDGSDSDSVAVYFNYPPC